MRELAVDFDSADLGNTYRFKILAYNTAGLYVESTIVSILFAIEPTTPSAGPTEVSSSSSQIVVSYSAAANNGAVITQANLEYALTGTTSWTTVEAVSTNWLTSQVTISDVTKGETYKFRFNVKNEKGWSSYSPETEILAASAPSQPSIPALVSADETPQVLLTLDISVDNGGSAITAYVLQVATGLGSSSWSDVTDYTSGNTAVTVSDTFVDAGEIHKFRFYATNAKGNSDYSDELVVAATPLPDANAMTLAKASGTETSITISWSDLSDGTAPGGTGLGYILSMTNLDTSATTEVFNGVEAGLPD